MNQFSQFVINHWPLWVALVIIVLLVFLNEFMAQNKKAKEISPQAAVGLINNEDAVVVDIRDKETYKTGHIIDSIRMKTDDVSSATWTQYKNQQLILVCAKGLQSPAVAAKLRAQGFNVHVLSGGTSSWQNADLPLVKNKG